MEGADYGAAIRVLRDSGSTVLLVVKRRASSNSSGNLGNSTLQSHRLTLTRNNKKDGEYIQTPLTFKFKTFRNLKVKVIFLQILVLFLGVVFM